MKLFAFAVVLVAALAVAHAAPGGLTGIPLLSQAYVPQTIGIVPRTLIAPHQQLIAPAPIATTLIGAGHGLYNPVLRGPLLGGALGHPAILA